jgi:hypothetical protein
MKSSLDIRNMKHSCRITGLAEAPQPFTGEEAWQTVGGKGADFWNRLKWF